MNKKEYNDYMECLGLHAEHNLLQDIKQFLYNNKEQLHQYLDKKQNANKYCSQMNKDALKYFIFPQYKLMNKR